MKPSIEFWSPSVQQLWTSSTTNHWQRCTFLVPVVVMGSGEVKCDVIGIGNEEGW